MPHKIVFMGTPDFAVESLKQILELGIEVAAVVTAPDRPAGRGQQVKMSAVKTYAQEQNLRVLQPEKLKSDEFINELKTLNAELFVVVAFRMLPEIVWDMPPKGTINLHGSLLPQYRGAAPINWAVINGDQQTGATTFFIEKEIDTGKIIDKVTLPISEEDTAGSIHDRLMVKGAELLTKTVNNIFEGKVEAIAQDQLNLDTPLKHAPKIFKADCKINWTHNTKTIYNKIRGLSPYPTAWTEIIDNKGKKKSLKIFSTRYKIDEQNNTGKILENENGVFFGTNNGWIELLELQLEGKKRMSIEQFTAGFNFKEAKLVLQ